ncbi:hypothetical protein ROA7450_00814 [Roseovarius albus]|uniref:Uncharacterized protein n=1 Tax=Roseovarius albus TaxID=1247867 RepID=A0A1X6YKG5_9RHOB|nr:hypothetical protein [Roseovarius albus]SLN22225.1 hypothetical protein ROA7450_00814 [Roseovarius albus]
MNFICKDEGAIIHFAGDNSLIDGRIERIDVRDTDPSVSIHIEICMRPSSEHRKIELRFLGCKEFGFYWSDDYYFYNIERVKFFQRDDGLLYVSFDPVDEAETVSEYDQSFISSAELHAYSF